VEFGGREAAEEHAAFEDAAGDERRVTDEFGVEALSFDEVPAEHFDIVINGTDAALIELLAGEQVQIVTSGATSAMQARITYEEVPNDVARLSTDSVVTR
jgi:hypothetical protein